MNSVFPLSCSDAHRRFRGLLLSVGFALLVVPSLFGCASSGPISETQCAIGDWQTLGHRDGALGARSSKLLELQEACIQHGVTPDRDTYMLGWEKGVREYCVPSNGFSAGESGQPNNNVCPEDLREDFVQGYQRGRSIHLTRARVEDLETKIEEGTARLQEVRKEIISTAAAQLNPLLTPSRRAELVAEVQGLNDEKNRLVEDLPRLRDELVTQERALDDLQQAMASSSFSIGN